MFANKALGVKTSLIFIQLLFGTKDKQRLLLNFHLHVECPFEKVAFSHSQEVKGTTILAHFFLCLM